MGKIKFEDQTIEGVWVEGILKALFSTKQWLNLILNRTNLILN